MLGPSGFFLTNGPEDTPVSYADMEIIHSSESGFNVLYRVSKNGRFFVYKALKPEYVGNQLYEQLLKKDFDIGFSLNHHGICQYYGFVNLPQVGNCIIMEWIDGSRLEDLISEGAISGDLAQKIICEICDALDYMHRKQVIHRDLKPENIMVTYNGQNVKIIDFGLSDADSFNSFKSPAGTRIYASPELIAGENIDGRSDIWSLGVIINEMSSGYRHIVRKCLRRDKSRRYGTAIELKDAVQHSGVRKMLVFVSCLCLVAAAIAGIDLYLRYVQPSFPGDIPAGQSVTPVVSVQPEIQATEDINVTPVVVKEVQAADPVIPAGPEKKKPEAMDDAPESIDSESLEVLLINAADQL